MEEQGELPGHFPECPERCQDLGEQEDEVKGVDGPLQGEDEGFFICQEEQDHWQLNGERQEPEGGQRWHLRKEAQIAMLGRALDVYTATVTLIYLLFTREGRTKAAPSPVVFRQASNTQTGSCFE